jgi:hypothetical protein
MGFMVSLPRVTDHGLVYHATNRVNKQAGVPAGGDDHAAFLGATANVTSQ